MGGEFHDLHVVSTLESIDGIDLYNGIIQLERISVEKYMHDLLPPKPLTNNLFTGLFNDKLDNRLFLGKRLRPSTNLKTSAGFFCSTATRMMSETKNFMTFMLGAFLKKEMIPVLIKFLSD